MLAVLMYALDGMHVKLLYYLFDQKLGSSVLAALPWHVPSGGMKAVD